MRVVNGNATPKGYKISSLPQKQASRPKSEETTIYDPQRMKYSCHCPKSKGDGEEGLKNPEKILRELALNGMLKYIKDNKKQE